jgi:hypothetical protein
MNSEMTPDEEIVRGRQPELNIPNAQSTKAFPEPDTQKVKGARLS